MENQQTRDCDPDALDAYVANPTIDARQSMAAPPGLLLLWKSPTKTVKGPTCDITLIIRKICKCQ